MSNWSKARYSEMIRIADRPDGEWENDQLRQADRGKRKMIETILKFPRPQFPMTLGMLASMSNADLTRHYRESLDRARGPREPKHPPNSIISVNPQGNPGAKPSTARSSEDKSLISNIRQESARLKLTIPPNLQTMTTRELKKLNNEINSRVRADSTQRADRPSRNQLTVYARLHRLLGRNPDMVGAAELPARTLQNRVDELAKEARSIMRKEGVTRAQLSDMNWRPGSQKHVSTSKHQIARKSAWVKAAKSLAIPSKKP